LGTLSTLLGRLRIDLQSRFGFRLALALVMALLLDK
jgi:hypothetical protein